MKKMLAEVSKLKTEALVRPSMTKHKYIILEIKQWLTYLVILLFQINFFKNIVSQFSGPTNTVLDIILRL